MNTLAFGLCVYLCFFVFLTPVFSLFFSLLSSAGGGLSGDGENSPDDGDSVRPSVRKGHSER